MSQDKDHAFEAAQNLEAAPEDNSINPESNMDEVNSEPTSNTTEPKTEDKQSSKKKTVNIASLAGIGLGSIAVVLSFIALLVSFGSSPQQGSVSRADIETAFADVDSSLQALQEGKAESDLEITRLKRVTGENTIAIRSMDTDVIAKELASINQKMLDLNKGTESSKQNQKTLQELKSQVEEIQLKLSALEQEKAKIIAAKQSTSKPRVMKKTAKNAPVRSWIEGYNLMTLDSWGMEKNAVLFNPKTQDYQYVAPGEEFRGWKFLRHNSISVVFYKKGNYLRVLMQDKMKRNG